MNEGELLTARVFKYDPTRDEEPHYETYQVPYTQDMRVLDILDYITEEMGHSLAYRWFCGVKKCGMCATTVNGRAILTCWEPAQKEMTIEPLHGFPIIRDLVIDRDVYDADLQRLQPFLQRRRPYAGFPEPLTHEEMLSAYNMMDCIECLICVSECPSYAMRDEGGGFIGPAPLVQLAKYALDPRDEADRAASATKEGLLRDCVSCYACTEACPNKINILEEAIDGLRRICAKHRLGEAAKQTEALAALVKETGLISPTTLFLRIKGFSTITQIPLAIRMSLRGRVSPGKVLSAFLGTGAIPGIEQVRQIYRLTTAEKGRGKK
ncbi:MAG: 2Fe-2S iron-sulfur cluster-binding protein [Chloroflexi bacterium]|nr:2Fe-2S iron-sulfur cluster-binding protein [Chloroflexota bacterium]MCL5075881.1 2Fe-2S iron-sulfur cluster-binding protein [Chloroflexota bacterium]